jgi:hypothetical protein
MEKQTPYEHHRPSVLAAAPAQPKPEAVPEPLIDLKFDLDQLNGEDWLTILEVAAIYEAGAKSIKVQTLLDYYRLVKRCVVGGLAQVPIREIPALSVKFLEVMNGISNPVDANGKN